VHSHTCAPDIHGAAAVVAVAVGGVTVAVSAAVEDHLRQEGEVTPCLSF
jgi:hypothetical protein